MSETGAQIGDAVTVYWMDGERMKGTVQYRPQAEGDSWVIHMEDGTIYHVQRRECKFHKTQPSAIPSVDLLAMSVKSLRAAFSGFVLRVAPNDAAVDVILRHINCIEKMIANAPAQGCEAYPAASGSAGGEK